MTVMDEYIATAKTDGQEITTSGNMQDCFRWADEIISAANGEVSISIRKVEQKQVVSA